MSEHTAVGKEFTEKLKDKFKVIGIEINSSIISNKKVEVVEAIGNTPKTININIAAGSTFTVEDYK